MVSGIPTSWTVASKTTNGAIFNNGLKDGNPYVGWAWGSDQGSATVSVTFNLPSDASSQTLDVKVEDTDGNTATTTADVTVDSGPSESYIQGTVIDTENNPIADAQISVYNADTGTYITSDTTDSTGEYSVPVDGGANYRIEVTTPSGNEASNTEYVGTGVTETVDFVLNPSTSSATIQGLVTDSENNPMSGVTVQVYNADTGTRVDSVGTNAEGEYTVSVGGDANYRVEASESGYESTTSNTEYVASGETASMNLVLREITDPGYIQGNIRDTAGNTLDQAQYEIIASDTGTTVATGETSDGTFTVQVPPGTYQVEATKSGYADTSTSVTVDSGETAPATLYLEETTQADAEIVGDVVDIDNNPIPAEHADDTYVELWVEHPDTGEWVDAYSYGAYHSDDGDNRVQLSSESFYTFTNVESGYTYRMTVTSPTATTELPGFAVIQDKRAGTTSADIVLTDPIDELWDDGGGSTGGASFSYSPYHPEPGETVTFTATDAGPNMEYRWNFNSDPSVEASGREVQHTYDYAGAVNVTLILVGPDGPIDSTSRVVEVQSGQEGGGTDPGDGGSDPGTTSPELAVDTEPAPPGETATLTFTIENPRTTDYSSLGFRLTEVPSALTIADTSSDGYGGDELNWFWTDGLPAGETHTVTVEVAIPSDAEPGQEYSMEAVVMTSESGEETQTVTLRATADAATRFDFNGDNDVGFNDVLQAIDAFNSDNEVGGQQVGFTDVLDAIAEYNRR